MSGVQGTHLRPNVARCSRCSALQGSGEYGQHGWIRAWVPSCILPLYLDGAKTFPSYPLPPEFELCTVDAMAPKNKIILDTDPGQSVLQELIDPVAGMLTLPPAARCG